MKLIVNSICPAIFGQEIVKLALCLAVFGGTPGMCVVRVLGIYTCVCQYKKNALVLIVFLGMPSFYSALRLSFPGKKNAIGLPRSG
jgi:hypothetical protein